MEYDNIEITNSKWLELREDDDLYFEDCKFTEVDFDNYVFGDTRFLDCQFSACSFSQVDLINSSFDRCKFSNCRLMGIIWTDAHQLTNPSFNECKMDYSSFQGLKLKEVSYTNCSLLEVDFAGALLKKANFEGSHLVGANFTRADLEKADLRGASGYFLDPAFTKLKGAKVSFNEAVSILAAIGLELDG